MGDEITGSAVIQHLAKTRARMIARGLEVPPPLRRGGGSSRIIASGTTTAPLTAATATKSNLKAKPKAKSAPRKAKKATNKVDTVSDDSGDDDDWKDDDSDAEYGQPAAKRAKTTKGPMKRKIKTEDSDDEIIPVPKATKRKATDSKPSEERSAFGHTDINGVPIEDDMETEDETSNALVGTGQPWLDLDDDHGSTSTKGKKSPAKKTLVVSLPTTPAKTDVFKASDHENQVVGDVPIGFQDYQVEDHQTFSNPITNDSTAGLFSTNGYGGAYGNDGGFQSQDIVDQGGAFTGSFAIDGGYDANIPDTFGTNMTGGGSISNTYNPGGTSISNAYNPGGSSIPESYNSASGSISDSYNFGTGNTVPYPIQTSWPEYQGPIGSYSQYTSLNQTPATTSAGADFGGGYFGNGHFDLGSTNNNDGYSFGANNDIFFNTDNIDGNYVDDAFFSSNNYGN